MGFELICIWFTDRVIIEARDRLKSPRKRLRFSATTMRFFNRVLSSRRLAAFLGSRAVSRRGRGGQPTTAKSPSIRARSENIPCA